MYMFISYWGDGGGEVIEVGLDFVIYFICVCVCVCV